MHWMLLIKLWISLILHKTICQVIQQNTSPYLFTIGSHHHDDENALFYLFESVGLDLERQSELIL